MRAVKIVAIVLLVYAGIVVAFESLLGYAQPSSEATIRITTQEADGSSRMRVVSSLETDGKLYVAANHWPRAWYRRALQNPAVQVADDGTLKSYRAVPVSGDELDRVQTEHPLPLVFRVLTGFPPRRLLRLDPQEQPARQEVPPPAP